jgi:glycosyltransferase involved in cell wall biosynthesis
MKQKVSIVIPVFNGSNFIKESLQSALRSSAEEIIVVDDGSQDANKTKEIIESLSKNVKHISLPTNMGVAKALNTAFSLSNYSRIRWLSHDDVLVGNLFETSFLKKLSRTKFTFGDFILMDEFSNDLLEVRIESKLDRWRNRENIDLIAFLSGLINGCTVSFPKKRLKKIGPFNELLRTTQDYDIWYRILKKYKMKHDPNVKVRYRIHSKQGTKSKQFIQEGEDFWLKVVNDIEIGTFPYRKMSKFILLSVAYVFIIQSPYQKVKDRNEKLLIKQVHEKSKNFNSNEILHGLNEGKNIFGKSDSHGEHARFSFGAKDLILYMIFTYKNNSYSKSISLSTVTIIASKYKHKNLVKIILLIIFRGGKLFKDILRKLVEKSYERLKYYESLATVLRRAENSRLQVIEVEEYLSSSCVLILLGESELELNFSVKKDFLKGVKYISYVQAKGYKKC